MGTFLKELFGGVLLWFASVVSKRVAFAAAGLIAFGGFTTALYLALANLFTSIAVALPSGPGLGSVFVTGLWVALPDNAPGCIAAAISFDVMLALYRWNVSNVKLAMMAH